ncbi:hypothetical protein FSP39_020881 [Pinctada imbricata]|uniref:Flavin-containing monooxygenase n=1 Tax=Pinctada imbricata TaxID=66713 RepID=A0AA88XNB6_PINIB|nr:hypothetical protein FSP39_020881 [Pinctada imbricata]
MESTVKKVAVIGAGASGLPAIKCCLDEGLEPVCFERTDHIGGLWYYTDSAVDGQACVMKSTIINTSKEMMSYSDFPMPKEYPNYMHNSYVLKYLNLYADHFDLKKYIRFKKEVLLISKSPDFASSGQWSIQVKDRDTGHTEDLLFDAVMICTGHHAEKSMPNFPGMDEFKGKVIHTHDYKDFHGYEDKRVVVVGIGNSGCDAAVDLSRVASQGTVALPSPSEMWQDIRQKYDIMGKRFINSRRHTLQVDYIGFMDEIAGMAGHRPNFRGLWYYTDSIEDDQACVMKSTVINTSKEMMTYSDFPIPKEFPVLHIKKRPDFASSGQWDLLIKHEENGNTENLIFDAVMICTGHHAEKNVPHFPGLDKFKGKVVHSHDYKDFHGYEDKRIVVIGIGNSGGDAAVELSRVASQVFLSTRRGSWILNRVSDNGHPADMVAFRRVTRAMQKKLPISNLKKDWEKRLNKRFDHAMYSLRPKHPPWAQHPTANDELPNRIISGTVVVKPNVKRFTENGVEFDDGTFEDSIDAVIMATGYIFGFPFLDSSVLDVKQNKVKLYKWMFPPNIEKPTLCVIGCIQPVGALMPISENQSRLFTRVAKGIVKLPPSKDMWKDIKLKSYIMAKRYVESQRHTIQVDYIDYMDELAEIGGYKPDLCGLWYYTEDAIEHQSCVMKSTVINTSKEMMSYSDFPIPKEYAIFMHNTAVLKYFNLYADKFGLKKYIRLKTEGLLRLPSSSEMHDNIRLKRDTMAKRYVESSRHTIQVDYVDYMDELAEIAGHRPDLFDLLKKDPKLAMTCYFGACTPYQYRLTGPNAWDGAREAILTQWDRTCYPLNTRPLGFNADKSQKTIFILYFVLVVILAVLIKYIFI